MNLFFEFITAIIAIVGSVIWTMVKILPKVVAESIAKSIEQQRDYDFKKALQVDSFYRQSGNSILQELMDDWITLATDMDFVQKIASDPSYLQNLIKKTIGYASGRSIKIAAEFFQLNFVSSAPDEDGKIDEAQRDLAYKKGIVYFAMMVASLKKDFTGEEISPTDILRLKITDYEIQKDFFEQTILEIEQSVRSKD